MPLLADCQRQWVERRTLPVMRLLVAAPVVAFVWFSAWARERAARAVFAYHAIGRAEFEQHLRVAAELRGQARRLVAISRRRLAD